MKYINRATIQGMIGKDPEFKTTTGGLAVVNFSIATTRKIKDVEATQWHRCVAFGKMADAITQAVRKGSRVHVEGEIQYQDYEVEGVKRTSTKIVVTDVSILVPLVEDGLDLMHGLGKSSAPFYSQKTDLNDELPF